MKKKKKKKKKKNTLKFERELWQAFPNSIKRFAFVK